MVFIYNIKKQFKIISCCSFEVYVCSSHTCLTVNGWSFKSLFLCWLLQGTNEWFVVMWCYHHTANRLMFTAFSSTLLLPNRWNFASNRATLITPQRITLHTNEHKHCTFLYCITSFVVVVVARFTVCVHCILRLNALHDDWRIFFGLAQVKVKENWKHWQKHFI